MRLTRFRFRAIGSHGALAPPLPAAADRCSATTRAGARQTDWWLPALHVTCTSATPTASSVTLAGGRSAPTRHPRPEPHGDHGQTIDHR